MAASRRVRPGTDLADADDVREQLPWSTSNEDLVELFATCGTVNNAEVLFEHGRSKGAGVVELGSIEEATTAKDRFNGYMYGG